MPRRMAKIYKIDHFRRGSRSTKTQGMPPLPRRSVGRPSHRVFLRLQYPANSKSHRNPRNSSIKSCIHSQNKTSADLRTEIRPWHRVEACGRERPVAIALVYVFNRPEIPSFSYSRELRVRRRFRYEKLPVRGAAIVGTLQWCVLCTGANWLEPIRVYLSSAKFRCTLVHRPFFEQKSCHDYISAVSHT